MIRIDTISPQQPMAPVDEDSVEPARPAPLVVDSVLAKTLYSIMSGTRVVVVNSPPGAGKTTLVVAVLEKLNSLSDMSLRVLTPTNKSGAALVAKLSARFEALDMPVRLVCSSGIDNALVRMGVRTNRAGSQSARTITVSTVASAIATNQGTTSYDLTIVDEAYMVELADAAQALHNSAQVLMVGDSGQIGPVVTANVSTWERVGASAPHKPAPLFFSGRPDAQTYTLPATYRLGAQTTEIVKHLYDFDFESRRTMTFVSSSGKVLPEIGRLPVGDAESPADMQVMGAVYDHAVSLVGLDLLDTDGVTRQVEGHDVAIVVSHNAQVAALQSMLAGGRVSGTRDITVGTADSLQGGQWPVVVAVDPLIGHDDATPHSQALGRLCVMLSRHTARLVWVHDENWRTALSERGEDGDDERTVGTTVRTALEATAEA